MTIITEDYVSFETAKLLKEKGFDEDINFWYNENGNEIFYQQKYDIMYNWRVRQGLEIYQCPTLQMAMKWLREVHHIHCMIDYDRYDKWYYVIHDLVEGNDSKDYENLIEYRVWSEFESYEDAVSDAIKYCLENLI